MCKFLPVLTLFASLAFGQTQTVTYSYAGLPIPIYPDDWDTVSVIRLSVPRSMVVSKVTVSVKAQFSGVGDLNVFLWSAAGTRTKLLERNCGGLVNIDTTFDDSAPAMFNSACPAPGSGPYRGNEPLANSNGQNAFGYWRLGIENNGSSRTGTLTSFSISISGTVLGPPAIGPNTIVTTAGFESDIIAPGDQVTILGFNLGPSEGARADPTQVLPTSLGGTTVTFDGVAAPLYFVSDTVVQAQVPLSLNPETLTSVQLSNASGSSAVVQLAVVEANPGVFTTEAGGHGQAKAFNEDGSPNGDATLVDSERPAGPGSVIQVLAAGLGPVDPSVAQGTPASDDPKSEVTLPISATIGGRSARVTYAGALAGQVGVYEVYIRVPAAISPGAARLVLSVNGNTSQNGVTVQVR